MRHNSGARSYDERNSGRRRARPVKAASMDTTQDPSKEDYHAAEFDSTSFALLRERGYGITSDQKPIESKNKGRFSPEPQGQTR
eukprot:scaffold644_cov357-Pavlova_lutheri.AAC.56